MTAFSLPPALLVNSTGAMTPIGVPAQTVEVPYENLVITVELYPDGRFRRVTKVAVKTDFLSPSQRLKSTAYLDVEKFYEG